LVLGSWFLVLASKFYKFRNLLMVIGNQMTGLTGAGL